MQVQNMFRQALTVTALVTVMAAPAYANVVTYSGPALPIAQTIDGLYLNVLTGSTTVGGAGWDLNIYYNNTTLGFWAPTGGGYVGAGSAVSVLAPGSSVGPSSNFLSTNVGGGFTFVPGESGYFGFRFINEATGATHYGYAQISTSAGTGFPASILSYAYENVANTAIAVVPEPSSYALMLAGLTAVGAAAVRRRKVA